MLRWLYFILILAAFLQSGGMSFNLLLMLVVVFGYLPNSQKEIILPVFFTGLIWDVLMNQTLGVSSIAFFAVLLLINIFKTLVSSYSLFLIPIFLINLFIFNLITALLEGYPLNFSLNWGILFDCFLIILIYNLIFRLFVNSLKQELQLPLKL